MKTKSISKLAINGIKLFSTISEAFDAQALEIEQYEQLTKSQTDTIARQGDEIKKLKAAKINLEADVISKDMELRVLQKKSKKKKAK